jgi:flagella basal body P-ring formation protein FlgA
MRAFFLMTLVGLGLAGGAGQAATLPAGMPLTEGLAGELLRAALAAAGAGDDLELRLDQPRLPLGNPGGPATEIAVEGLRYDADSGRFSALLVGTVGATERFRLPALGRAHELTLLPVLARRVAAGELIAAADLDWITVAPHRLRPTSVTEARQLIGSEARRPLAPGRVLTQQDLQAPRLVQRGRAVALLYARPGLQLRALGIAQADGALGDLVQVINADSQQRLQGVVTGPDEVSLGGTVPGTDGALERRASR